MHELKIFILLQKKLLSIIKSYSVYEVAYLEEEMENNWKAQRACFLFNLYSLLVLLLFGYRLANCWIIRHHKKLPRPI